MLFETIPPGTPGRWAFGVTVLVFLIAHNETCGPTAVFSTFLAAFYGILAAICKSELKHLQIPYIRASNKFDFLCLFLGKWIDALALLTACGALARTLSTCLDAMTGGLARMLILGRNSPANEPWPDVLGVVVVFLVTGMFMLGLENTKTFSFLMSLGMLGISGILSATSWLKGNTDDWSQNYFLPNGLNSFLTAAALASFAYPSELPPNKGWKRLMGPVLAIAILISTSLTAGCLSLITHYKSEKEYSAVPILEILQSNDVGKLVPAAACLLVLSSSGSFLELFPEMYNIVVQLATSEWKILARQISYENPDSGSPVLAIFIGGSLTAMLAFACPLQNLVHILAASHLCGTLLRGFYLLYSPFRPKYIQQTTDANLSYSRLSTEPLKKPTSRKRSAWNFNVPIQNAMKSKSKKKSGREVEKEWLLLGEPSSPRPTVSELNAESSILSDAEPVASDLEYNNKLDNSDSDISTDIDAIVDEYRQKIKVTTAGPMEKTIRVPTLASWRITMLAIFISFSCIILTIVGVYSQVTAIYVTGIIFTLIIGLLMSLIPKYTGTGTGTTIAPLVTTTLLLLGSILFCSCLYESWPAVLFWLGSGLILFIRCDTWCCLCLDRPVSHQIIPSVSGKTATIRIPRPPSGLVVAGRVQGHHRR